MLRILLVLIVCFFSCKISAQPQQSWRIMFYNVENFFDTEDDYDTEDDEFLPVGFYRWTQAKFEKKRDDIAHVIEAVGGEQPVTMVGLCEVENRFVLQQLTHHTKLKRYGYAILHNDSPDIRGIDVALIYLPHQLQLIDSAFIKVNIDKRTREILYAKGVLGNTDTLHVFVNHWPSKLDGEKETECHRMEAAKTLRSKLDSILSVNPHANILAMGDFNDLPQSKPVEKGLKAKLSTDSLTHNGLINLAATHALNGEGTSKYKGKWQLVDMMFCSARMLDSCSILYCNPKGFTIYKADFLLQHDKTYKGVKPKRTLAGPRYIGGVSDHLPIYVDIKKP